MIDWTPDDLRRALDQGQDVFLKLWKKGCGICKLSVPATDRLEKQTEHDLIFAKISVDDHAEMLEIAGTDVLPTFFIFKNQKKAGQYTGFKGLKKLEEFVEESMTNG